MRNFRKLLVWQRAHNLVLEIYRATSSFPSNERFSLIAQMRRSATSIPSKIAEGAGHGGGPDYARFLRIAAGSVSELDYQLLLSRDLGYVSEGQHDDLSEEVVAIRRMLASLIRRVVESSG
ncbi:MAG: four helix bundle protein [Acidimicrobiia bacterium]|nr:MAG: four helix bundle protein [Acidimicrobiia bacterium]